MNKFYKISLEQYLKDGGSYENWNDIKIPCLATKYSAGHDFFSPYDFTLEPNETIKIATGIKAQLDKDKVLFITPRSSLGFKYRLQLDNTIGIVDSDYYNNNGNEGHIFIKLTNDSNCDKVLTIKKGEAFAQGIIVQFFKAEDQDVETVREGGIGSTNGK